MDFQLTEEKALCIIFIDEVDVKEWRKEKYTLIKNNPIMIKYDNLKYKQKVKILH